MKTSLLVVVVALLGLACGNGDEQMTIDELDRRTRFDDDVDAMIHAHPSDHELIAGNLRLIDANSRLIGETIALFEQHLCDQHGMCTERLEERDR